MSNIVLSFTSHSYATGAFVFSVRVQSTLQVVEEACVQASNPVVLVCEICFVVEPYDPYRALDLIRHLQHTFVSAAVIINVSKEFDWDQINLRDIDRFGDSLTVKPLCRCNELLEPADFRVLIHGDVH